MKKLFVFCALILVLSLAASPASALMRFGIHGGFDLNSQDSDEIVGAVLSNNDEVSITRDEIKAPLMGGIHLLIDATPIIDIELGLEGSLRKYHVLYEHVPTVGDAQEFNEDIYFHRLSIYASGKFNMINLPLVKGYVGGGAGYHLMGPLLSRELLEKQIVEQGFHGDDLEPGSILDKEWSLGVHALFGLRFKPAFLPLALSAEGRYYILPENDYGDDTNRFLAVSFGFEFGI